MPSEPEFYVGYLPVVSKGLRRFRRRAVAGLLLLAAFVASLLTAAQQQFSAGLFEFLDSRRHQGVIVETPYPLLIEDGLPRLLTGVGKFGAQSEAAGFDGRHVRLEGKRIHLGAQEMIEVVPDSIAPLNGSFRPFKGNQEDMGEATLEGEMVDTKCYLGVMNPGRGKVHAECAARCISGGVPPGFLVRDRTGESAVYLLVDSGGQPIREKAMALAGRAVRLTGRLVRRDGAVYFRTDLSAAVQL